MTIRPICIVGEPVLHSPAQPVTEFGPALNDLVADMFETMDKAPGVGLAAPQIGVNLRVFVYDYPDDKGNARRGAIVNPQLEVGPLRVGEPDWETESEGCLSVPGERFPLVRADYVRVRGVDLNQEPVEIDATGWFARIFQHEYDHLEGVLYIDRLVKEYRDEVDEVIKDWGWGTSGLSWLPGKDKLEG